MKTAKLALWVNPNQSDRGQKLRPVTIQYSLSPPLRGVLYHVISAVDYHTGEVYPVEGPSGILALNADMDERIAAADPVQVAFAAKELGVKLGGAKKKIVKSVKKQVQSEEYTEPPW